MEKEADTRAVKEGDVVAWPWLGPWVVITRIRPPRAASMLARGKKPTGV